MKIECPIYDYSCPYCIGGNCCMKEMDGADPREECEMGFDPYLGCYTDDC